MKQRCAWVPDNNPLYTKYHDTEWGRVVKDDRVLFEFLVLEGAQAGLSWETVLGKREEYRKVFHNFSIEKVAKMSETEIQAALHNPGIIRNRLKITSAVKNARVVLTIQKEFNSFFNYFSYMLPDAPKKNHYAAISEVPSQINASKDLSKDLKKRGCTFVGPTIMYAFMQATGLVNDHTIDCFCYKRKA